MSVEDGLGQINGAKDEADKIGRMQTDSKEMAMQVLDASKETEQFAHKLGDTSERLKELVASLREQTGQVVEQGKSQRKVTEEVDIWLYVLQATAHCSLHFPDLCRMISSEEQSRASKGVTYGLFGYKGQDL